MNVLAKSYAWSLLLASLSGNALAGDAPAKWYLGAAYGIGEVEVVGHNRSDQVRHLLAQQGLVALNPNGAEHDDTTSWQLFGGYRFQSWLATELGYIDLGQTDGN